MSALILLVSLLGGVWCLGSALLRLYRCLASRRVSPAEPRLWRDQRRRFLWSAALGVAFFVAFGVVAWWSGSGTSEVPLARPVASPPPMVASGQVGTMPIPLPAAEPAAPQAPESPREAPVASAPAGSGENPATPEVKPEAGRNQASGGEKTTGETTVEKTAGQPEVAGGSPKGPADSVPDSQSEAGQAPAQAATTPAAEKPSQAAAVPATHKASEEGAASSEANAGPQDASAPAQAGETPAAEKPSQTAMGQATEQAPRGEAAAPTGGESPQAAGGPAQASEAQVQPGATKTTPAAAPAPTPAAQPQEAEAAKRDAWTVCAASFRRESMAQNYAQRLAGQGLAARVSRADLGDKGVWYRVCLGGFASLAEAKRQYQAWEEQGLISDAFLLPLR
ncbi:SPOR domain-containing protein [Desulfoferula mesophila]|uniref:SPOR domain-containing protein n=1 Tax=Desulfoferula mesophila TaxID=3058419 RepID=A0AAU9F0U9_9BACT|nr:hypothetical protein FAK_27690 [Desulfoferula mesophilus]